MYDMPLPLRWWLWCCCCKICLSSHNLAFTWAKQGLETQIANSSSLLGWVTGSYYWSALPRSQGWHFTTDLIYFPSLCQTSRKLQMSHSGVRVDTMPTYGQQRPAVLNRWSKLFFLDKLFCKLVHCAAPCFHVTRHHINCCAGRQQNKGVILIFRGLFSLRAASVHVIRQSFQLIPQLTGMHLQQNPTTQTQKIVKKLILILNKSEKQVWYVSCKVAKIKWKWIFGLVFVNATLMLYYMLMSRPCVDAQWKPGFSWLKALIIVHIEAWQMI